MASESTGRQQTPRHELRRCECCRSRVQGWGCSWVVVLSRSLTARIADLDKLLGCGAPDHLDIKTAEQLAARLPCMHVHS